MPANSNNSGINVRKIRRLSVSVMLAHCSLGISRRLHSGKPVVQIAIRRGYNATHRRVRRKPPCAKNRLMQDLQVQPVSA